METLLAILRGPLDAGLLFPNIWLAVVLLVLKLFDAWSTNYIVGRKGGMETISLSIWLMAKTGSVQVGLALDVALVAVAAWLCYPFWWMLAGIVAWYGYWMAMQVAQVRKSQPK